QSFIEISFKRKLITNSFEILLNLSLCLLFLFVFSFLNIETSTYYCSRPKGRSENWERHLVPV
ncbi:unnamed protein product, partial [Callosobruchus maculatus]